MLQAPPSSSSKTSRSAAALYNWASRKRSVSPSAPQSSHTHKSKPAAPLPPLPTAAASSSTANKPVMQPPVPTAASPTPTKRYEEPLYHEEDYSEEIQQYMANQDAITTGAADLMDMQPELQWFMRPYLIDFIVEVHQQFRLRPEVLYLSMNIVDRYVSKRVVYKKHYQLVGCAALWIAAKFEDGKDKVPLVRELCDMCCKAYDESAFIQMEGHVLSTVGWNLGHPTAEAWLRIYMSGRNLEDPKVQSIARFVMEITLFHREFVGIRSAFVAHGALMLARYICGKARKPVGRFENVAVRVAMAIDKHFGEKLETISEIVIRKYAPTYYSRASTVVREWYLSGRRFQYTEVESTPLPSSISTPGLAPSTSWPNKRGSWMSTSPSAGSLSCASSDAGDETAPITPITPVHNHVADPFSAASKENMPPRIASSSSSGSVGSVGSSSGAPYALVPIKDNSNVMATDVGFDPRLSGLPPKTQAQGGLTSLNHLRPVLHALSADSDQTLPNRNMRRASG